MAVCLLVLGLLFLNEMSAQWEDRVRAGDRGIQIVQETDWERQLLYCARVCQGIIRGACIACSKMYRLTVLRILQGGVQYACKVVNKKKLAFR